jgi:hypothetical protein
MRTLYIEGVAIHDGPESCAVVCEGGGEALAGVHVGGLLSRERISVRGADAFRSVEGNTGGSVIASCRRAPRGRRTCACVESPCASTGRSRACPVRS